MAGITRQSSAVHVSEVVRRGLQIADAAVICDIEHGAAGLFLYGAMWFDVRPMLDENEHSPMVIDMAVEALTYAEQRGLIHRHDVERHLVRINRGGA